MANGALVIDPKTKLSREIFKIHLPNWGVFDEVRVFAHATQVAPTFEIAGVKCGLVICRDIWIESSVADLANMGARVIFVPNASPYANSRSLERTKIIQAYAKKYGVAIVYINMIEGCDELVFDGGSYVVDSSGDLIDECKRFEECFIAVDLETQDGPNLETNSQPEENVDLSGFIGHDVFDPEEVYRAILLGTTEFINSIGPDVKVCIGLSGGVDSALVATIAVDALGADRVYGVLLPSKFTSEESNSYAIELAKNLGITHETISIEKLHETATQEFGIDALESIVSENVQSRLRGLTLMMISNSRGHLVLSPGNKSEAAVGYSTLYGDTVGAWAPIKDVYKTQVYKICEWRNMSNEFEAKEAIPESIISRAPTAELRSNQTDEESLYPYDLLDGVLELFIDHEFSASSIVEMGFDPVAVERIIGLVKSSEFKRKQSPIGPRLTRKNFGRGRRIPISAHW